MQISSRTNPLVKEMSTLAQSKGRRTVGRTFVEGLKITEEALRWSKPLMLILTPSGIKRAPELFSHANQKGITVQEMTEDCFGKFSQLKSPEGIAAVLPLDGFCKESLASDALFSATSKLAVAVGIQDPSNAGAISRVAEAAGATGMVVVNGADCANPKFLRASMGSAFRLPCVNLDEVDFLKLAVGAKLNIIASDAVPNATSYKTANYTPPVAVCVGAEGMGIPEHFLKNATQVVKIPMQGHPESLNVAVAAGILLYTASSGWTD